MTFAIKAAVRDPRTSRFSFSAQKTMYGGKRIAEDDTVFLFASENEGGSGLIARGVVTSASYEARAFGVRSGMSIRDATKLAPHAVFTPGRHDSYGKYSADARAIVERYSPIVRAASIDEHYIDFHGCERLYHRPGDADSDATIKRVVSEITDAISNELGLPSSAGRSCGARRISPP